MSYLFGPTSYGNYPEIQALWAQYQKEISPSLRNELIVRVQKLLHERIMWVPLINLNTNTVFGPRVKGNPYRIQPRIWFTAPFEDIELAN